MKLKDLCSYLDSAVPLSFQESYDNSGLQVGQPDDEIKSALLTLDVTGDVIDEAVREGCNLIISHHPVIFGNIRNLTGKNHTERILLQALRNNIAIYSSHTNLDIFSNGVSRKLAEKTGLKNISVLSPSGKKLLKLVTFIPEKYLSSVSEAIFDAGAGVIGNYDRCGFTSAGEGSFRPGESANPFTGEKGKIHFEKEIRFETILFSHLKNKVISALLEAHPYEEVAYDLYPLENETINEGSGCIGDLDEPMNEEDFLRMISSRLEARAIRHSKMMWRMVKKVAVCGGAGSFLLGDALARKADVFITSDVKYHTFFEAENRILLVDCGHYETEKFSTEILYDLIVKKFPKFALRFSEINTNPINYS
jgi:dinuclear metal center YbgI/SA1388 family protein